MKILSASQIREADLYTIEHEPIPSTDLMERAAEAFANWFASKFDKQEKLMIFCGPGNNGGDGLAIARLLMQQQYEPEVFIITSEKYSSDFVANKIRLEKFSPLHYISAPENIPAIGECIIIDALFGTGLTRPASGIYAEVIRRMNESPALTISVDVPSGLFTDEPTPGNAVVEANITPSFQVPKLAFLLPENDRYVGDWFLLDIGLSPEFLEKVETPHTLSGKENILPLLKKRGGFSHKGIYGRALIIGGSYGMIGACILASKACLHTGVGLCRTYTPACGYQILQTAVPESIAMTDPDHESITAIPDLEGQDAIAIGPGLSENERTMHALEELLKKTKVPLVIDAGALNLLSKNKALLRLIPAGSILTPHPKEFERLTRKADNDFDRLSLLTELAREIKGYVVLKGAYTAIANPEGKIHFNSTGNPGMATAGSGDVLTGIITSLLAQKYSSEQAAILGVYLHGYAGDVVAKKYSQEYMTSHTLLEGISGFFLDNGRNF